MEISKTIKNILTDKYLLDDASMRVIKNIVLKQNIHLVLCEDEIYVKLNGNLTPLKGHELATQMDILINIQHGDLNSARIYVHETSIYNYKNTNDDGVTIHGTNLLMRYMFEKVRT